VTPLGGDVETTWANLIAGKSGAGRITRFDSSDQKCHVACEVKPADHEYGFDPAKRVDHKVQRQVDPFIIYGIDDHAGAGEVLRRTGRSMFFGDVSAVGGWEGDPRVELHGPGYSKILIGDDMLEGDRWQEHVGLMAASIAENGGRSCVNASGIWVAASHAERVAEAVAAKLATIVPRAADDDQATLAPFADPRVAERISAQIDQGLQGGGREVTLAHRGTPRLAGLDGCTYLQPTLVLVDGPDHPLANREFLFPFAAVVPVAPDDMRQMPGPMGKTLVVTALTRDRRLIDRLLASPLVDRLNVGAIQTNTISWDQPHEGNLFEHLYARRSFQQTSDPALAAAGA
jgi:hypothetical protein